MTKAAFAIPGDIDLPTGGYAYDRRILALLPELGVDIEHMPLPRSFPRPSGMDLCTTAQALVAPSKDTVLLIDGLAYGAFSAATVAAITHKVIALVHHPLAFETGIGPERAAVLLASETAALARADHIIVTSRMTAVILQADLAVPANKITVAEPGTDPAPRATGSDNPFHILAVGSIVPRKGYTVLVEALAGLKDQDWQLTIAGATRDTGELALVEAAIAAHELAERITIARAVDDATLSSLYANADLFVMPSLFEGYGMVLAEAMARGLPIVCTTGGAAAETVPDGAAIKVPPGDAAALATGLRRAIGNQQARQALADAAWTAGQKLPSWNDTARVIATVIKEVAR
jgi:glycosyltransferase involved in cell wall biosynthesis